MTIPSTLRWALLVIIWLIVGLTVRLQNTFWHTGDNSERFLLASSSPSSFPRRILFVHIGKAGGETIKNVLKVGCDTMRNPRKQKRCVKGLPHSQLSTYTVGYLHCFSFFPRTILNSTDSFLFNLRPPVDRALSWYRYIHPANCQRPNSPSCIAKEELEIPDSFVARFFRDCFPTFENWTLQINDATKCGRLGRKTLLGKVEARKSNPQAGHMTANYQYYFNQTLSKLPENTVYIVRMEHLWDDLSNVDRLLGGNGSFGGRHSTKISHGSEQFGPQQMSKSSVSILCCKLQDEMQIYRELLWRASNLNEMQKIMTWAASMEHCGWTSWDSRVC